MSLSNWVFALSKLCYCNYYSCLLHIKRRIITSSRTSINSFRVIRTILICMYSARASKFWVLSRNCTFLYTLRIWKQFWTSFSKNNLTQYTRNFFWTRVTVDRNYPLDSIVRISAFPSTFLNFVLIHF